MLLVDLPVVKLAVSSKADDAPVHLLEVVRALMVVVVVDHLLVLHVVVVAVFGAVVGVGAEVLPVVPWRV